MSSRGLLLALLGCSCAGLAAIGLFVRAERGTTDVHAASPDSRLAARSGSDIDAAPETPVRASATESLRRVACRGRVLGDFGDGAENVAVEIGVLAADGPHVFTHVQSGQRGAFHCDVGIPSEVADQEDAHLFARIEHDGYPRRLIRRSIASIDYEVTFRLSLGLMRLIDVRWENGEPEGPVGAGDDAPTIRKGSPCPPKSANANWVPGRGSV